MNLPVRQRSERGVAHGRFIPANALAARKFSFKLEIVGSIAAAPAGAPSFEPACLYRYPSPEGRSHHPNGRPPAFFPAAQKFPPRHRGNTGGQVPVERRFSAVRRPALAGLRAAVRGLLPEPALWRRVPLGSNNNVRGTDKWYAGNSSSPPPCWAGSRRADNHSASRPSSGQAVAQPRPRFSVAVSAPAPLWVLRPTSPIARTTPAAAEGSRAALTPRTQHEFPATVAFRRGGLFFGTTPAARTIAGLPERDVRCSRRS